MLGIVAVLARLRSSAVVPMLHLRAVNPHVASLLTAGPSGAPGKLLTAMAPRAAAPAVDMLSMAGGEQAWHSGVSSFAFQVSTCHHASETCHRPRNSPIIRCRLPV